MSHRQYQENSTCLAILLSGGVFNIFLFLALLKSSSLCDIALPAVVILTSFQLLQKDCNINKRLWLKEKRRQGQISFLSNCLVIVQMLLNKPLKAFFRITVLEYSVGFLLPKRFNCMSAELFESILVPVKRFLPDSTFSDFLRD